MGTRVYVQVVLLAFICTMIGVGLAQTTPPFNRAKKVVYVIYKGNEKPKVQKEWGFGGFTSFIPLSLDAFKSQYAQKTGTTIDPKSSLTGLPWFMTFEQQIGGGLPVAQWPPRSDGQSSQQGSTTPQPAPVETPAPSAPVETPAPTPTTPAQTPSPSSTKSQPAAAPQPSASSSPCSADSTDKSASAVHACVNAMRTDPRQYTAHYKCDYSQWIDSAASPRRPALRADDRLARSAAKQAEDMAGTRTVSHVGSDGSSMAQRIAGVGFTTFPQAENVAGGQQSAIEVAAAWMCSEGHRTNIVSCDLDTVGSAMSTDVDSRPYYVQDFGCSVTNSCHC